MPREKMALVLISIMFFNIGVMFCMNDVLLPVVKDYFRFSYLKATMIQMSFYVVYIIWPMPIARAVGRFGYRKNILASVGLCLLGCLMFVPAYFLKSYALILLGVFTLSTGITIANVVANPYVTILGIPSGAHMRLNLVQALSRVGYAVTPLLASQLIYSGAVQNPQIHLPYLFLSIVLFLVIGMIYVFRLPDIQPEVQETGSLRQLFNESRRHPVLFWGIFTMFFYLGVEACTAGFFISYAMEKSYDAETAATFLTYYYVLAATFALIGTLLLKSFKAGFLLAGFGVGMIICLLVALISDGRVGLYALVLAGGFLSIMFPTVFSLAIEGLGAFREKGSALLNFAIVGGAVFPPFQGLIADYYSVSTSYLVPLICVIVVTAYGMMVYKFKAAGGLKLSPLREADSQ